MRNSPLPRARGLVAALALTAIAAACAPADVPERRPLAPAPPVVSAPPPPFVPGATEPTGEEVVSSRFDASQPPAPLDDPRLAAARHSIGQGKKIEAARAVEAALATATDLDPPARARWQLQAAVLRRDGGDPGGAIVAFSRAAAASDLIAPSARVEEAALLLQTGRHAEALRALESIAEVDRTSARHAPLHAEALVRTGDATRGAAALEAWVDRAPRPPGWALTALRVLGALGAKPGAERAVATARIARKVMAAANGPSASEALALLVKVEPRASGGASIAARVESARAKLRARDARAAVAILDRLTKVQDARARGAATCELWTLRGEALGEVKRRAEAAESYGVALELCDGPSDELLFTAARASARGERAAEAADRFERLERTHRASRLADDARVERVRALIEVGDLAAAEGLAESAMSTYPDGDVVGDAVFLVAQAHMVEGRWAAAVPLLERGASAARERSYLRAGRFAYFLGRAHEALGDRARARASLERVLVDHAIGHYGALAHARLEELQPGAGAAALALAIARAGGRAAAPDPTDAELAARPLARAAELAAVGDAAAAEAELDGMGLASRSASAGLRWAAARLLARADAVRAHAVLRGASETEPRPTSIELDGWLRSPPSGSARAVWEVAFPRPYADVIDRAASESGSPAPLLFAIMREESAFAPSALSRAGARGLLQLMPATAARMARPLGLPHDDDALQRPEINARLGARFLSQMRGRFAHAPLLAVPAYNAGPLAVDRWCAERSSLDFDLWVETIPYRETRHYTKRVLSSLAAYDALAGATRGEVYRTPRRACPAAASAPSDDEAEAGAASTD